MQEGPVKIKFQVDQKSLADIHRMLSELPEKMRGKVIRGALRKVLGSQLRASKNLARPQDVRTRRDLAIKTKTYKRGRIIWASVGVLFDSLGGRRDSVRQGWRAHFHDVGYRPWRKGVPAFINAREPVRTGRPGRNPNPRFVPFSYKRDWRKGKKRIALGSRILATGYLTLPARRFEPMVVRAVTVQVEAAVKEANNG